MDPYGSFSFLAWLLQELTPKLVSRVFLCERIVHSLIGAYCKNGYGGLSRLADLCYGGCSGACKATAEERVKEEKHGNFLKVFG